MYTGASNDTIGGTISFSPGTKIEAVYGTDLLKDKESGIDADYSGFGRGIEEPDYVKIDSPKDLSFEFNFMMGVDDFRVIIDYGDQFTNGAYFEISFFGCKSSSYAAQRNPGIQVGNIAGDVPGSGDLGEVIYAKIPLTREFPSDLRVCIDLYPPGQLFSDVQIEVLFEQEGSKNEKNE